MLLNPIKKSNKIFSLLLAVILVVCSLSVSCFAVTDSEKAEYEQRIEELQKQIEENKKKIEEAKKKASVYDDDVSALQDKIGALQEQIDLYNEAIAVIDADIAVIDNQIKGIENEIDSLNKQIEELDKQVVDIQQKIADTYTLLGERIRASYMSGASSSLEYLLTSDEFQFQSYLERVELIERIAEHDDTLIKDLEKEIDSLKAKVLEIEDMKTRLDGKIKELDEVKKDHEAKKKVQVDARQEILDAEAEIQKDLDKVMAVINEFDKESKAYQAAIDKAEDAIMDYENKLAEDNTSFGSGQTGDMIWPLPYSDTYVSSSFKMRTLNGVTKQHNGIDICRWAGTHGATIVAVKDGTVEVAYKSGNNGGYGLYVVINHGNGVKTYYAHLSATLVNVGDYVTQGTTIGRAGNTGYSFGAHLHFGLMINGGWVNPMNYLSKPSGLQIVA